MKPIAVCQEDMSGLADLIFQISRRDARAFAQLHALTRNKMRKTASAVCGRSSDVDDILQEGYLKIWRNAGKFDPARASAIAWMSAIIRNTAIDALRVGQRHASRLKNATVMSEILNQPGEGMDQEVAEPLVSRALSRLPEDRRRLISSAYIDGESRAVLSQRLGVPVGTIKTWLRRGLETVRKDYLAAVAAVA